MVPTLGFSTLFLSLLFSENLFRIQQREKKLISVVKILVLLLLIMLFPLSTLVKITAYNWDKKSDLNSLTNQILSYVKNTDETKTIAVFSTTVTPAGILAPYADVNLGSRFAGYWMLPGIVKHEHENLSVEKQQKLNHVKKLLNTMVVSDFKKYQPELVLVDINKEKEYFPPGSFNYVYYFSQDPSFAAIWRRYHYQKTIGNFAIYTRSK